MRQTQIIRIDGRMARRLAKLLRAQLALLPSSALPLALRVPHLPNLPSLSSLPSASLASLSTALTNVSTSLPTLSSLPPQSLKLDPAVIHAILTRALDTAHTRLPQALTRALPTDPAILQRSVEKLAYTQARAYTIRYGIQVALSFALRLLPEVGRSLPVPLRLALSLTRMLVRQVVGQVVRVVVGVLVRQFVLARGGRVGLGKAAARAMRVAEAVSQSYAYMELTVAARSCRVVGPPSTKPAIERLRGVELHAG